MRPLLLFMLFIVGSLNVVGLQAGEPKPLQIGDHRELFVDDYLIGKMKNVSLRLHQPVDEGVVLKFDKPWEGLFCGYCTIIKDGDLYRAYYRGRPQAGADGDAQRICRT